jgi:hypothetical protein
MTTIALPTEVEAVFREFRTAEFSTLARDGTPITWPTLPFWQPEHGTFLVTTSIGLPRKAFNVRRDPRVSLLFSDPTASGLTSPPAVLIQADATAPDEVSTEITGFEENLKQVLQRQPAGGFYSSNPITRALFERYYMRLQIVLTPRRIVWWPRADVSRAAETPFVASDRPAGQAQQTGGRAGDSTPDDTAWGETLKHLSTFASAVLTGRDGEGYPFSVRCRPGLDPTARRLRMILPPDAPVEPGPAGLLCHWHDEQLWNQRSFVTRGRLERDDEGWHFQPRQFVPGLGMGGPLALIRFTVDARRAAKRYLAARGLARPTVPWDAINAVKAQATRDHPHPET